MKFIARDQWWRLKVLNIPRCILGDMQVSVENWVRNSGVDWTISRLKSLKVDLLRHKVGLPPITYIAKNRQGKLKGWIGSLFSLSLRDDRSFSHCLQALMAYTMFVHPSLTDKQWKKFVSGVESKETFVPEDFHQALINTTKEALKGVKFSLLGKQKSLLFYQGSPSKRAPQLLGPSLPQDQNLEAEIEVLKYPMGRSFYHKFQNSFCFVLDDLDRAKIMLGGLTQRFGIPEFDRSKLIAGNIGFIQEPGGKARCVANPFRIYQKVLQPLGDALFSILKDLPWDCTFDQSKAFPTVQEALRKNHIIHCVDLSSATDYFPLSIQMDVLRTIFGRSELIDLFEDLSRAAWRTNKPGQPLIRWTRGQPMGLYPSFPSFGLTHGLLLLTLSKGDYRGQFFIVGDDVIILDDKLAKAYQLALELLECPFSPEKTISSSTLAEFAGKIITKDMIIPQLKWRKISDNNFVDVMKLVGQRAKVILTKRQRAVYDKISSWYEPYGCNHSNGLSLPLEKVILKTLEETELYFDQNHGQDSLVDLSKQLYNDHYGVGKLFHYLTPSINRTISTFDEKVARTFQDTIFGKMVRKDVTSAKLFADVVSGKDNSCLPQ